MFYVFSITTIIISYFLNRLLYKKLEDDAEYLPHGVLIFLMLIPILNLIIPIGLIVITSFEDFNFKKFFRLK